MLDLGYDRALLPGHDQDTLCCQLWIYFGNFDTWMVLKDFSTFLLIRSFKSEVELQRNILSSCIECPLVPEVRKDSIADLAEEVADS